MPGPQLTRYGPDERIFQPAEERFSSPPFERNAVREKIELKPNESAPTGDCNRLSAVKNV